MGILEGIKIIEVEGIGPAPFASMHLADLGADVVRIARPKSMDRPDSVFLRGKRVVTMDLKDPAEQAVLLNMIRCADGLIEGMRPGVMERLGLGPDICLKANPKLAYGRLTGWGQDGPLAKAAGHDLNYIALSGALWYSGQPDTPPFAPPTLIGDVAGGALYLTIGMLAAILKAERTGQGDVIDAAMVDGNAHMMNLLLSLLPSGNLNMERGQSILDGPHWYETYQCACGGYVTIGALEPQFYALFLGLTDLSDEPVFADQYDRSKWPAQKEKLAAMFKSKSQQEWCDKLEGTDVCFAPVLNPKQAANHPHMKARENYTTRNKTLEAAPAPRFTNHPSKREPENARSVTAADVLAQWGKINDQYFS